MHHVFQFDLISVNEQQKAPRVQPWPNGHIEYARSLSSRRTWWLHMQRQGKSFLRQPAAWDDKGTRPDEAIATSPHPFCPRAILLRTPAHASDASRNDSADFAQHRSPGHRHDIVPGIWNPPHSVGQSERLDPPAAPSYLRPSPPPPPTLSESRRPAQQCQRARNQTGKQHDGHAATERQGQGAHAVRGPTSSP